MSEEPDPYARAELSVVLEEVTSSVRHDLRNKLGSIRNAAYYVKRRLGKTEAWAADPKLDAMTALLESDVTAANQLLAPGDDRIHARRSVETDAQACALAAARHSRARPAPQLDLDVAAATLLVDPAELTVAIRCLVENAAEATAAGGCVRIRGGVEDGAYWIHVRDQGPGLGGEAGELALQPFYTTKPGRFGLGLNVALRIAQRHRGKIVIAPSLGEGASVSIGFELNGEGRRVDDPAR